MLGIIAQESQGNPYAEGVDGAGSIGLMQVLARSWTGTRDQLKNPSYNVFVGMRMLHAILDQADGDIRMALAAYNCGWQGIDGATGPGNDRCGPHGGYAYADRILQVYVPIFRAELTVRAGDDDAIGEWLASLRYDWGYGRWWRQEEEVEGLPYRLYRGE